MGRILTPDFFRPPPLVVQQNLAQEKIIQDYRNVIDVQTKILSALCWHARELSRGKKVGLVPGGFTVPFNWCTDIPPDRIELLVEGVPDAGLLSARLLEPRVRERLKFQGEAPDEQKRLEDETLA